MLVQKQIRRYTVHRDLLPNYAFSGHASSTEVGYLVARKHVIVAQTGAGWCLDLGRFTDGRLNRGLALAPKDGLHIQTVECACEIHGGTFCLQLLISSDGKSRATIERLPKADFIQPDVAFELGPELTREIAHFIPPERRYQRHSVSVRQRFMRWNGWRPPFLKRTWSLVYLPHANQILAELHVPFDQPPVALPRWVDADVSFNLAFSDFGLCTPPPASVAPSTPAIVLPSPVLS